MRVQRRWIVIAIGGVGLLLAVLYLIPFGYAYTPSAARTFNDER
jgi:hypothetical protein